MKKEGPRKGWRFIKCRRCDPDDPSFWWVDTMDPFTDEQREAIKRDLFILLGECDGAHARDDVGFNGYDAPRARRYAASLRAGAQIDWAALACLLHKYRKTQLGGHDDY